VRRPTVILFLCLLNAAVVHIAVASKQRDIGSTHFVRAEGHQLLTPDGKPLLIKGIGLGNWLVPEGYMWKFAEGPESPRHIEQVITSLVGPAEARRFWTAWRRAYVTREDLALIKRVGFNTVRVPFASRLFLDESRPGEWLDEGFARLDDVVTWARELGLWVVLDMHGAPGGQTGTNIDDSPGTPWLFESAEHQDEMVQIWRRIAERYRDEPTVLGYELLNEPIAPYLGWERYNRQLEPLYKKVTASIRGVDPDHLVILGGAQWNTNFDVFGPPFDKNLLYAFHKYWSETTPDSIEAFLAFRDRYNVPVWLGETGENKDEWIRSAVQLVEPRGIGWCFWPYKKMDSTSGVVSFARPEGWEAVVAYGQVNPFDYEAGRKARPDPARARAVLAELLDLIRLDRGRQNEGYIRALGLVPATASSR
jgi:endoglucanase